jgi:hypothetical protein
MNRPPDTEGSIPPSLTDDDVTRMLQVGFGHRVRPIDDVVQRLLAADGEAWFAAAMAKPPLLGPGVPMSRAAQSDVTIEELEGIKSRCKDAISVAASDRSTKDAGVMGYFLVVASGLAFHDRVLASRDRAEIDEALAAISDHLPKPWSAIVATAIHAT